MRVILENSPTGSAYLRASGGEYAAWPNTDHLLALGLDQLRIANWQRADPKKHPPYPEPTPRPGVESEHVSKPQNVRNITQARAWAARRREA